MMVAAAPIIAARIVSDRPMRCLGLTQCGTWRPDCNESLRGLTATRLAICMSCLRTLTHQGVMHRWRVIMTRGSVATWRQEFRAAGWSPAEAVIGPIRTAPAFYSNDAAPRLAAR